MKVIPTIFEDREIRRLYDEKTETWFFSVVDIVQILTQQPDYKSARNYWKVLKNRLGKEGSQLVTNCNQLKLPAACATQTNPRYRCGLMPGDVHSRLPPLVLGHFETDEWDFRSGESGCQIFRFTCDTHHPHLTRIILKCFFTSALAERTTIKLPDF